MSFPETSSRWGIWPTEVGLEGPRKKRRAQRSVLIQGVTVAPKNVARCSCRTTDFTISWYSCHNTFTRETKEKTLKSPWKRRHCWQEIPLTSTQTSTPLCKGNTEGCTVHLQLSVLFSRLHRGNSKHQNSGLEQTVSDKCPPYNSWFAKLEVP